MRSPLAAGRSPLAEIIIDDYADRDWPALIRSCE
jgi:hypothetical protein